MKRSHSVDIFVSTELDTFSMNPEEGGDMTET